jgi:hypothetical protein
MKKIICFIFGHDETQMCTGSVVSACRRCGELSDFTLFCMNIYNKEE